MARRKSTVTISNELGSQFKPGRDEGKIFVLTEMPAAQAEDWAIRALLALTKAGAEIPSGFEDAGMATIAVMGVQALMGAGLAYADVKPLMDEMFTCVQIQPNPRDPSIVRVLVEDDIEEVTTRALLRKAIVELHVGFSRPGVQSKSSLETPFSPEGSVITRTSPAR
jgi:hypothetical protein